MTPLQGESALVAARHSELIRRDHEVRRAAVSAAKTRVSAKSMPPEARPLPHHDNHPQPNGETSHPLNSAVALLALLMKRG